MSARPLDDDELLPYILLQLDGAVTSMLRCIADGGGPDAAGTLGPQVAKEALAAALASRLVSQRWRHHSEQAVATTRIRCRLLMVQLKAAVYHRFLLIKSLPTSSLLLQRAGRADALASELVSPTEFLVAAYENAIRPMGANASAAMALLRHLRVHDIHNRFVIVTSPKKVHSWKVLIEQAPNVCSRLVTCNAAADFEGLSNGLSDEVVIVSYTCAPQWPEAYNRQSYVILDEARQYMWRPSLRRCFDPSKCIFESRAGPAVMYLLLDDYHSRPCTLFELFHLVFTWHGGDKAQKRGPLGLQESIMEARTTASEKKKVPTLTLRSEELSEEVSLSKK